MKKKTAAAAAIAVMRNRNGADRTLLGTLCIPLHVLREVGLLDAGVHHWSGFLHIRFDEEGAA
jgi:hypothetical protein